MKNFSAPSKNVNQNFNHQASKQDFQNGKDSQRGNSAHNSHRQLTSMDQKQFAQMNLSKQDIDRYVQQYNNLHKNIIEKTSATVVPTI